MDTQEWALKSHARKPRLPDPITWLRHGIQITCAMKTKCPCDSVIKPRYARQCWAKRGYINSTHRKRHNKITFHWCTYRNDQMFWVTYTFHVHRLSGAQFTGGGFVSGTHFRQFRAQHTGMSLDNMEDGFTREQERLRSAASKVIRKSQIIVCCLR